MGSWDHKLPLPPSPIMALPELGTCPLGINPTVLSGLKTSTSLFLLEAWILPVGKVGRGEEEAGPREQPAAVARELDLRALLFLAGPGLPRQQQQGLWLQVLGVFTAASS